MPKNISVENPLFFNILPDENPDMEEFLPSSDNGRNKTGADNNGSSNGWTMQVTDTGKVFYVDNNAKKYPPKKKGPFFNSPPSPLSLMDVLTVGSSKDSDDKGRGFF